MAPPGVAESVWPFLIEDLQSCSWVKSWSSTSSLSSTHLVPPPRDGPRHQHRRATTSSRPTTSFVTLYNNAPWEPFGQDKDIIVKEGPQAAEEAEADEKAKIAKEGETKKDALSKLSGVIPCNFHDNKHPPAGQEGKIGGISLTEGNGAPKAYGMSANMNLEKNRSGNNQYMNLVGLETYAFMPSAKPTGPEGKKVLCDDLSKLPCWWPAKVITEKGWDEDVSCDFDKMHCIHLAWKGGVPTAPYTRGGRGVGTTASARGKTRAVRSSCTMSERLVPVGVKILDSHDVIARYSCPEWISHPITGTQCKQEKGFQACPHKFTPTSFDYAGNEVDLAIWWEAKKKGKTCGEVFNDHCVWKPKTYEGVDPKKGLQDDDYFAKDPVNDKIKVEPLESLFPTPEELKARQDKKEAAAGTDESAGKDANGKEKSEGDKEAKKLQDEVGIPAVPKAFYFDVLHNKWLKCLSRFRCQDFPIKKISESRPCTAGEAVKERCSENCMGPDEFCMEPMDPDEPGLCAHKSGIRVITPDERGPLMKETPTQPFKMGYLTNNPDYFYTL